MPDDPASLLSPIRERRALVAAANLKADAFGDVYAAMVQLAREDSTFLLAAVEAALKLHKPVDRGRVMRCCEGCEAIDGEFHPGFCHEWPCPTVEAITAALTGTPENDSAPAAALREDEEP